jgi:hypothetical protein
LAAEELPASPEDFFFSARFFFLGELGFDLPARL